MDFQDFFNLTTEKVMREETMYKRQYSRILIEEGLDEQSHFENWEATVLRKQRKKCLYLSPSLDSLTTSSESKQKTQNGKRGHDEDNVTSPSILIETPPFITLSINISRFLFKIITNTFSLS